MGAYASDRTAVGHTRATSRDHRADGGDSRTTESSNASSNTAELNQTDAVILGHITADHPNRRTASDGSGAARARPLIRGFPIMLTRR
jgi:hypothetical protein